MKTCKQCTTQFEITDADRVFYNKIDVPEPTWCPECRNMRRLAWRNERTFYNRPCDLCGKSGISINAPQWGYTVYCISCWWSDQWSPLEYGTDFDFSRSFFEQFHELTKKVPRITVVQNAAENSEYSNEVNDVKNTYMAVCSFFGERLFYTYWLGLSKDCVDTSYILESELCYESHDIFKCYHSKYIYNCENLIDCAFCFNCSNCQNCFNCFNLKNKSYCINNKQLTKEKYFEELKKIDFSSFETVEKKKKEFWQESLNYPRKFAFIKNTEDCTGDYVRNSKNVSYGFDIFGQENGKYLFDAGAAKDSMDCTQAGIDSELMYEVHGCGRIYNTHFANWSYYNSDCEYVESCHNSNNLFACVGMRKSAYCIFNKQYSKEEYVVLRDKIIAHMKKTSEYGEFFPLGHSTYTYNESVAQQWYPMSREQVLAKGWRQWQDAMPGIFGKETVAWPVAENSPDITKEILACTECRKNYKIIKQELEFYKKMNVPLPRFCPDCRFYKRIALRNPRHLWHRQCMCGMAGHDNHHDGKLCNNTFETSYAPERPEKVFCEGCYQAEIT